MIIKSEITNFFERIHKKLIFVDLYIPPINAERTLCYCDAVYHYEAINGILMSEIHTNRTGAFTLLTLKLPTGSIVLSTVKILTYNAQKKIINIFRNLCI